MPKRTTVTLEDDVAARLAQEARRSGATFKEVINRAIRAGLASRPVNEEPFEVQPRALGLKEGLSYDNIGDLLEHGEGNLFR